MSNPVAFTLRDAAMPAIYPISLDPGVGARLDATAPSDRPAVLAVKTLALVDKMRAGIFDAADAEVWAKGDWSKALLIVMESVTDGGVSMPPEQKSDDTFLSCVRREAPEISDLASHLIRAVRRSGIGGHLVQEGSRWVNRPLNTFTLTVQTRVKNFAFTLYGGPDRFGKTDFIKSDQNGYSRGWVRSEEDIPRFVELAKIAHARKAH